MEEAAKPPRPDRRWVTRAEHTRDEFGLVLVLVLVTYVVTSLLEDHGWSAVILGVATSATSIVALTSSHVPGERVRLAIGVAGFSVLLTMAGAAADSRALLTIGGGIQVLLLAVGMAAVLRRVIQNAGADSRTILGAISVYTVFGLLFTFIYVFVARVQSAPFFEGHPHARGSDFIFFSYTTLTTTGYGDLVPGGQPGRMLAGLEMMVGQIFLVTLVAGLVSLWRPGERLRKAREARAEPAPDPGEPR